MGKEYITHVDIINDVARDYEDLTRRQVAKVYRAIVDKIEESLQNGVEVNLSEFVKFELVERKARYNARNPFTKQNDLYVPAKTIVRVRNRKRLDDLTKIHKA